MFIIMVSYCFLDLIMLQNMILYASIYAIIKQYQKDHIKKYSIRIAQEYFIDRFFSTLLFFKALIQCSTCLRNFCSECGRQHEQQNVAEARTIKHLMRPLWEATKIRRVILCQTHPTHALRFYCIACQQVKNSLSLYARYFLKQKCKYNIKRNN